MQRIHGKIISITLLVILSFPFAVNKVIAQGSLAEKKLALNMIADFADRLCNDIPLTGGELELTGKAKGEVSAIFKKIAGLGFEGAAKYQNYEGLLQKDLAKALKDSSTCKLTVFRELNGKIFGSGSSSKPRNNDEIDSLIALRRSGDILFAECRGLGSKDVPQIAARITEWERNVMREVRSLSKVALNKVETARRRRNNTVYGGRNAKYDAWMDRLEFQIEALNEIIEGR